MGQQRLTGEDETQSDNNNKEITLCKMLVSFLFPTVLHSLKVFLYLVIALFSDKGLIRGLQAEKATA